MGGLIGDDENGERVRRVSAVKQVNCSGATISSTAAEITIMEVER